MPDQGRSQIPRNLPRNHPRTTPDTHMVPGLSDSMHTERFLRRTQKSLQSEKTGIRCSDVLIIKGCKQFEHFYLKNMLYLFLIY